MRLVVVALFARSGRERSRENEEDGDTLDGESWNFLPALSESSKLPPRVGPDTALGI